MKKSETSPKSLRLNHRLSLLSPGEKEKYLNWISGSDKSIRKRAFERLFDANVEAETARVEAETISLKDALTDIPNRRYFDEELSRIITHANRSGRENTASSRYAVVVFDLKGLKPINDNMGNHAGDAAIKALADKLQAIVRADELAARFGGDEFAALLIDTTHNENFVSGALEHFNNELAGLTFEHDGKTYPLGVRLGIIEIKSGMPFNVISEKIGNKFVEIKKGSEKYREGPPPAPIADVEPS